MPIAAAILGLLVIGAILGTTLNFAGVFLGLPFALLLIVVLITREQVARQRRIAQLHRFRRRAAARSTPFTEADKRTVV